MFHKEYLYILLLIVIIYLVYRYIYLDSLKVQENYISNLNESIILFYADWCGHCKTYKPLWNKFKQQYANKNNFIEIEHDKYMECQKEINESNQQIQLGYKDAPNSYNSLKKCNILKQAIPSTDKINELLQSINGYPTLIHVKNTKNNTITYKIQNRNNFIKEISN